MIRSLSVALLLTAIAPGADLPDYLPLQVGNLWVYRGASQQLDGGRAVSSVSKIAVSGIEIMDNRTYHVLEGFSGTRMLVRRGDEGAIWEYDPVGRQDRLLLPFHAAEGELVNGLPRGCGPGGSIASRSHPYQGPVGDFNQATLLTLINVGTCIAAGVPEVEVYLPWVGMLSRSGRLTGGGGVRFEMHLIYARLGGVTVVSEPETAFSLSLNGRGFRAAGSAAQAPLLTVRMALWNTNPEPLPRQQRFELEIRNSCGDLLRRTSDVVATGAGETVHTVLVPLLDTNGIPLRDGRYMVGAVVRENDPPLYSASASFEIVSSGVPPTTPGSSCP